MKITMFINLTLAKKNGKYYKISKEKIGAGFDLYINEHLDIDWSWFYCITTTKKYKNKNGEEKSTTILRIKTEKKNPLLYMDVYCIVLKIFTIKINYILKMMISNKKTKMDCILPNPHI